ncbi:MAG TPA: N-acetylmuramoyl-L-alanine amidase [Acidimicrobiales bacterium]|nr:N-acetylmuramoyl-L-alanine amidase [Acidimicrobiales bacterium]
MRRSVLLLVLLALAAVACGGPAPPPVQRAAVGSVSASGPLPTSGPATPASPSAPPSSPTTTAAPRSPSQLALARPKVVVSPTGVVLPVTGFENGGVRVMTPCENSAVLDAGTPVNGASVVLDAGHGGTESGAVGANRLAEKTANLAVTLVTRDTLVRNGVSVLLTRTADYGMTLNARAAVVKAVHPVAFVSIHHNADPDGPHDGPGTETYYQLASGSSKRLAGLIYEEVTRALAQYRIAWVGDTDAGAKYRTGSNGDYYAVLRQTAGTTSVLGELSFISNPPEADLLAQPAFDDVEGQAVARGILRYLRTKDPGSGFTTPYPRTTPAGGGGKQGCVDPALR